MDVGPGMLAGFLDELEKIGAAHGRLRIPKERRGRRSMRVDTLLKKEKDGTLYKAADAQGNPQPVRGAGHDDPGAAMLPRRPGEVPTRGSQVPHEEKLGTTPYPDPKPFTTGETAVFGPETPKRRKPGDVPSKEDENRIDRLDGRGEATTISGLAQRSANIGIGGGEHY